MPTRVTLEVVLDLANVALEARAQGIQPSHLLGVELRRGGLRAIDARRPTHHDRLDRWRLLTRGEQLKRADDVDVVHRSRRDAAAGLTNDLVVHDGVDPA